MKITTGGAHMAEDGSYYGLAGDQSGKEVSIVTYNSSYWTCAFRPTDAGHASAIAAAMVNACNNNNIGYNQNERLQVIKAGVNASYPINCDCSSLVRACIIQGAGVDPGNFTTSTQASALLGCGIFVQVDMGNPKVGDVLWRSGHTEIVVDGSARSGSAAELADVIAGAAGTIAGIATSALNAADMASLMSGTVGNRYSAVDGSFRPRLEKPLLADLNDLLNALHAQQEERAKREEQARKNSKKKKSSTTDESSSNSTLLNLYEEYQLVNQYDIWYIPTSMGGKNPFDFPPMTNEAYAWCRFSEIMNEESKTSRGPAYGVFRANEDGYVRNMAPMLGAMMCFYGGKDHSTAAGFVCIVEDITEDGELITSEVVDDEFYTTTRKKRYGSWDDKEKGLVFQGFIHNPAATGAKDESPLETFLRIAEEHVGDGPEWSCSKMNISTNGGWSAAFVGACAAASGSILNIVLPNTTSCSSIGRIGVLRDYGTWLPATAQGSYADPQVGDIITFRRHSYPEGISTYICDGAGIVTQDGGSTITVIEGDMGQGKVIQSTYAKTASVINGYFRPEWSRVDRTTEYVVQYRTIQGLYTQGTRIEDAAAREIGYLNSTMKPSISPTGIRLSAINYTGLLANMYSVFGSQLSTSDSANAELIVDFWTNTVRSHYQEELLDGGLELKKANPETIGSFDLSNLGLSDAGSLLEGFVNAVGAIDVNPSQNLLNSYRYLTQRGLSTATVVGILGNIQRESGFNTAAIGDHGTSGGLCQWHNDYKTPTVGRFTNMRAYVGTGWESNLTGQLDFLLHELQTNYTGVWSFITSVPNSLNGAQKAADYFVRRFEVPADVDNESKIRQKYAAGIWERVAKS